MDDYIGMTQAGKSAAAGVLEKEFMATLKDAYSIAVKNALPIVLSVLLWALTLWIPYINIGTTIALWTLPIALSRNQPISPTFIFDKRYRQFFGEFFLTGGMMLGGILAGLLLCGFPAIVIFVSWCLAPLLVLDKGCNASEALTLSNKYTYGNKLLIFILFLALDVSLGLLLLIVAAILEALASVMATVVTVLLAFILIPATGAGLIAAIYKRLVYQNSSPSWHTQPPRIPKHSGQPPSTVPMNLFSVVCLLLLSAASVHAAETPPEAQAPTRPAIQEKTWETYMAEAREKLGQGGGYACTGKALTNFIQAFSWDERKGLRLQPGKARPSFCSSAVYGALLLALELWNSGRRENGLGRNAWQALAPRKTPDGTGAWGCANANGPGLAVLIHKLGAGHSFTEWEEARSGDIMKLWWTEAIGVEERGHLTIYLSQTEHSLTFWSSNQSNPGGTPGYGTKTIPKSTVKHVLFTRVTRPEAFANAPHVGTDPWLRSLLKKNVTMEETLRRCGLSLSPLKKTIQP